MPNLEIFARKNFKRHVNVINKIIHNYSAAEDIVQDAYVKALINIDKFDSSRSNLNTWFNKILFNVLRDHQRKFKSELVVTDIDVDYIEDEEDYINLNDPCRKVNKAIDAVKNPKHRKVLILYYELGYTNSEIAELEQLTITNVTTICNRFREKMRRYSN